MISLYNIILEKLKVDRKNVEIIQIEVEFNHLIVIIWILALTQ
jgi:hypothetical protein